MLNTRFLVIAALLAVQIIFGINYVVSKSIVTVIHPMIWATARMTISAVLMVILAFALRRKHPPMSASFFGGMILWSLFGVVINQSTFLVGLKYTTATNSAVITTMIPVITLFLVVIRGIEPLTIKRTIGFLLAFAGVLSVRKIEDFSFSDQTFLGDLLNFINCISFSIFLAFSKNFVQKIDSVWMTAWMFIFGAIGIGLASIPFLGEASIPVLTSGLLGAMTYAILAATILAYFLNNWALARAKSSHVALYIYFQPIVASAIQYFYLNEPVSMRTIVSCGLIFLGMLTALKK